MKEQAGALQVARQTDLETVELVGMAAGLVLAPFHLRRLRRGLRQQLMRRGRQ